MLNPESLSKSYRILTINNNQNDNHQFALDVLLGLSKQKKQISSKYFYDKIGCQIYNEITRLPEYYLTQCEWEIFEKYKSEISQHLQGHPFNLVELGPGEGKKTQLLLDEFIKQNLQFQYVPMDISADFIDTIVDNMQTTCPHLEINALVTDYFHGLTWLKENSKKRNVVLFLGSTIGNFDAEKVNIFLQNLWFSLNNNDFVLIGFDLRKDLDLLLKAYSDSEGVTRRFNLNLLSRINRELGGNFNIDKFSHYATYNVYTGAMESYLMSQIAQTVTIEKLERKFSFKDWEPIHVEYSYKYLMPEITALAEKNDFKILSNFVDRKNYYVASLWQVKKVT